MELWHIMGCSGVILGAPPGATEVVEPHPVVVPGLDGQTALPELQSWHDPDGSSRVLLVWYSDAYASSNTQYHVRGQTVSVADVIRIAASMRPGE